VALYNPKAGSPAAGFFCGGVIIDDIHVATAAHCIAGGGPGPVSAPSEVEVLAGSTHLSPADPGSVRDPVAAARIDARYNPFTSDYDVGVLTLARKLWSGPAPPPLDGTNTIAPLPVSAAQAASYASPNAGQAIVATPHRARDRAIRRACRRQACPWFPTGAARKTTRRSNRQSRRA
jgi:hypothetical protein